MNLPTKITVARMFLIPVMLICFCLREVFDYYYILAAIAFGISSATDFVDGFIARKYNMVTDLGKFLDPIADKILVVAGLTVIIADAQNIGINIYFVVVATTVILAREFIIGVFRQIAASKGKVLQADKLGKIKTIATLFGISFLIIAPLKNIDIAVWHYIGLVFYYAGYVLFAFATLMTVVSGVNYIVKNKSVLSNKLNDNDEKSLSPVNGTDDIEQEHSDVSEK